jgi:hypothetical protein
MLMVSLLERMSSIRLSLIIRLCLIQRSLLTSFSSRHAFCFSCEGSKSYLFLSELWGEKVFSKRASTTCAFSIHIVIGMIRVGIHYGF